MSPKDHPYALLSGHAHFYLLKHSSVRCHGSTNALAYLLGLIGAHEFSSAPNGFKQGQTRANGPNKGKRGETG